MLSDIGDNDQLLKYPVDSFDDVLRGQIRLLFHHEWMHAFPCIDFIQPLFCIIFMHIFQHFIDCFSGIRNNRDVYLYIFRDRGSININMHYFGIGRKGMQLSRDPVKTILVDMTRLGLVEITRKKVRRPLHEIL